MNSKRFVVATLLASSLAFSKDWKQTVEALTPSIFEGIDSPFISRYKPLLESRSLEFQEEAVRLKVLNIVMPRPKDSVLDAYSNPVSLRRTQNFLRTHQEAFLKIKYQFRMPFSAPASILYVETLFGLLKLKQYPTLSTLVSLAALSDADYRKSMVPVYHEMAKQYSPSEKWKKTESWSARLEEIGLFWKNELKSFLLFAAKSDWSLEYILSIQGSWVGAFGHNQMLPSTALRKVERFGMFDPWSWEDAIYFTAAELHAKGWSNDPKDAIYQYNQARWYVDAVWSLHQKLEAMDIESKIQSEKLLNGEEAEEVLVAPEDTFFDRQDVRSGFYEQHL